MFSENELRAMDSEALAELALAIEAELDRRYNLPDERGEPQGWRKMTDHAFMKVDPYDGTMTPLPLKTEETE